MRKSGTEKGDGRRPSTDRNARKICIKREGPEGGADGVICGTFGFGVNEAG
jgi:hypothetical protein